MLSTNPLNVRLGHVAVVPVIGSRGPELTHATLTADAGLTRYEESYVDITRLQPAACGRFRRRRGLLTGGELTRLERGLCVYPGL